MNCPKCNKELLNVNGKYVCVECGIEVPEAENNLQKTPETSTEPPILPDTTMGVETALPEAMEPPKVEEDTPLPINEVDTSPSEIPGIPQIPQSDLMPIKPEAYESVPISDLEGGSQPLAPAEQASPEIPAEEVAKESVVEDLLPDMPKIDASIIPGTSAQPVEPAIYPQESAPESISQEADPIASMNEIANPIKPIEIGMDNLTEPADLFEKKEPDYPQPEQSDFDQPQTPQIIPPIPPAAPISTDPSTIFQDPMYDKNPTTTPIPPINQTAPAPLDPEEDDRKLKIILIAGIVVAVILLIIGIITYVLLT